MRRRFPIHRQLDATGCARACVRMICEWHGIRKSDRDLSSVLPDSSRGTSLLAIENVLTSLGFVCDSFFATSGALDEVSLPAVLHWDGNHYVVLYAIEGKMERYIVADPAKGRCSMSAEEFRSHWISTHSEDEGKNEETSDNLATGFEAGKSIRIDNVDFRYDRHALKKTLEGVSFDIPEGKVTAIVGASGSGKTTLIKSLNSGIFDMDETFELISVL